MLEKSKSRTKLFSAISPSKERWLSTGSGKGGVNFNYLIFKNEAGIELYIDTPNQDKNKAIFDALHKQKDQVDAEFGNTLNWMRLDEKQASRIRWILSGYGGLNDSEAWPLLQEKLIDAMIKLDKSLRNRIAGLQI